MAVHLKAWRFALARQGLTFPTNRFYELAGKPMAEIVTILAHEQGLSSVPSVEDVKRDKAVAWSSESAHGMAPVLPSKRVMEYARDAGMKIAVASGGQRQDVIESLAAAGYIRSTDDKDVQDLLDTLVTAEDVEHGKPHPETFLLAARRMKVEPARCVGLEDADLGIEALLRAGMRAVDIRTHHSYPLPNDLKEQVFSRQVNSKYKNAS